MKDIEKTVDLLFDKNQLNTMDRNEKKKKFTKAIENNKSAILNKLQNFKFHPNWANEDDRVIKYRELLKQEKQAFIEQSKIVGRAEIENKILKNHYRKALENIRNELSKILTSDKSFNKFISKVNQSDSVHVNPAFEGSSGRLNAKSQNSFTHLDNELEINENNEGLQNNLLNIPNFQQINRIETSGFMGNNISGTTGGDDDPALKFNNLLRKSQEKNEISCQSLKRLTMLQEMVMKYQKMPFHAIFEAKKHYFMGKNYDFNKTVSQDSINQAFTSFFGQSDMKDNNDLSWFHSDNLKLGKESKNSSDKEIQKDASFALLKEFEIKPYRELEVLKEIKEEIKEESMRRKKSKKHTITLTFEEWRSEKDYEADQDNCNFSEISEIKEDKNNG
jgi:hypothetical protein